MSDKCETDTEKRIAILYKKLDVYLNVTNYALNYDNMRTVMQIITMLRDDATKLEAMAQFKQFGQV